MSDNGPKVMFFTIDITTTHRAVKAIAHPVYIWACFGQPSFVKNIRNTRQFGQKSIYGMTLSVIHFRYVDFLKFVICAMFMVVAL